MHRDRGRGERGERAPQEQEGGRTYLKSRAWTLGDHARDEREQMLSSKQEKRTRGGVGVGVGRRGRRRIGERKGEGRRGEERRRRETGGLISREAWIVALDGNS